jgi:hypothetical protein
MPSVSKKQHNFMAAIANNPKFAKKVGVPQSVGKDFNTADKGKTFKEGGTMKKPNPFMEMIAKKKEAAAKKPAKKMAKGGGVESKGKTKGKMVTMKKGGKAC